MALTDIWNEYLVRRIFLEGIRIFMRKPDIDIRIYLLAASVVVSMLAHLNQAWLFDG